MSHSTHGDACRYSNWDITQEGPMTSRRENNKQRATHMRVLESLEEVVKSHPAGAHLRTARPEVDPHQPLRAVAAPASNVIDIRSRFALTATNNHTPNDAA